MMRWILETVVVLAATTAVRAEAPLYQVEFLGAGWTATAINENGDACGTGPYGGFTRAGVSHAGQPFEPLPLPAGMVSSRAHDMNDDGVIVGAVCTNEYIQTQPTAAVWQPVGTSYDVVILGGLPGDAYSAAFAVNDLGDIVGASGFWGWNPDHGILYGPGGPEALPAGFLGVDINDQRVVVSGNRLLDLDTGGVTTIPLPAGNWQGVVSSSVNGNNEICGYIAGYSSCSLFPVRWRETTGWEFLGGCAPTATSATAMNDRGDALQYYYSTTSGASFVDEGYFMLGSLIAPGQEYYIQYGGANGINNARQIVAAARQGFSGPIGAVRMTPLGATDVAPATATASGSVRAVPNPSRGGVRLEGPAELVVESEWGVFDVTGRRLSTFQGATWNGRTSRGDPVPAGVYFLRPLDDAMDESVRLVVRH